MLLDRSKLEAAYTVWSTTFDMSLQKTEVIYPRLATVLQNVGPLTEFRWMGEVPVMREWLGNRIISRLRAEGHSLRTKWYANGVEIDVDDVANDRLGIVKPQITRLAQQAARKIDAQVIDYYNRGFGGTLGTTYDGQYLFDTDHTASQSGGASQSNVITGALSAATLNTGIGRMMGFADSNGEPINIVPDTLIAGPSNQLVVREILAAQFNANGASNVNAGIVNAIVNARISGSFAGQWYLAALNQEEIRPVMVGIEVPVQFHELMGWEHMHQFMHRTMLAGADGKWGLAYGAWQVVVGSTG